MPKLDQAVEQDEDTTVVVDEEETVVDQEDDGTEEEGQEDQGDDEESEGKSDDDEESDVVVTIGDEQPEEDETAGAPTWVRELRKAHRETARENKQLKEQLEALQNPKPKAAEVGNKPSLSDDDIDYDADKYEQKLAEWYERKRKADEEARKKEAEIEQQQHEWNKRLETYATAKQQLKVRDFDDAESVVLETLSLTQQGIVVQGAEDPALVVYALGKNSKKAKDLAAIADPVKFAFAVAKLEKDLKVTNRKKPPAPEKVVTGSGSKGSAVDSKLEQLRAEAEKTGDYSKVMKYKRDKKRQN